MPYCTFSQINITVRLVVKSYYQQKLNVENATHLSVRRKCAHTHSIKLNQPTVLAQSTVVSFAYIGSTRYICISC